MQDYDFPLPFTASPEVTAKGRRWVRLLSELLVKTNLKPNPVLILPRGLAGVAEGFEYMIEGKVRIHVRTLTSTFFTEALLGKCREDHLSDRRYGQRVKVAHLKGNRPEASGSILGIVRTLVVSLIRPTTG